MAKRRNVYRKGPKARDYDLLKQSPFSFDDIGPQLIRAHAVTDKQLSAEYSRLRSIANKRLQRMEGKPEAQETYAQHAGGFPKVSGMSRSDIVHALHDVTRFLVADRGSLSGIHRTNKKIAESLKEKGINVPEDQLAKFGSFMNAMKKALNISRGEYGSHQIAELWTELFQKGKISQSKFEKRVKEVMRDIEEQQKELYTRAQLREHRKDIRTLLQDNPISDYFDELALDPRTVRASERRSAEAEARGSSRRARQRRTFRRRK
jgi:polyhydroxyalkanoate synthesis regulator phasin